MLPLAFKPGRLSAAVCSGWAALAVPVCAQEVRVTPAVSVSETVTSNRNLSSSKGSVDAITQVSPSVALSANGPGLRAALNYSMNLVHYLRASGEDNIYNTLDASLQSTGLDGRGSIDARAGISQQTISPFGTRNADARLVNDNNTEVYRFNITPQFRTRVLDWAFFSASLNYARTGSSDTRAANNASYGGGLSLSGSQGKLGWYTSFSRQSSDFTTTRRTTVESATVGLNYSVRYDLTVGVNAGRQGANVLSSDPTWIQTTGWSVQWQPTERTNIAAQNSRTFYGRSHSYVFNHRMARSIWSYIDSNSASGIDNQQVPVALTLYDLLLQNCVRSGGGTIASCDVPVRNQILQAGLNPGTVVGVGFLTTGLTRTRSRALTAALTGTRDTITITAFRTETVGIDPFATFIGGTQVDTGLRQQGLSLGASHQLTESSSASLNATQSQTLGTATQAGNTLRSASLSWNVRPSGRTNASVTARATRFSSPTNPYSEYAVIGTVSLTF